MATLGLDLERGLFLGIDFGTTNSVVSIYNFKDGEAQTIPLDGSNIFPTAVQFETDPDDETKLSKIFGIQAKEAAVIYPMSTVLSIKRLLGSEEKINITVDEKEYSFLPEEIAGEIIGYLKLKADEYVQEELNIAGEFSGCVITVPANSTDKQKQKTKQAAILAGFDEESVYLRLEPAAAAISYAINETNDKNVLVYDFGGGTFDACLLQVKIEEAGEPAISILSTYGDNNLGGNDIDKIIMDMIYEEFKKLTNNEIDLFDENADDGVSKRQKKVALVRLNQVATQAKERLSQAATTKIVLAPLIQEPKIVNINMEISRDEFLNHQRVNQLGDTDEVFEKFSGKNVHDILNMTLKCVDDCINAAGFSSENVNEIFLVGGSSSISAIGEKIKEKFNKEPYKSKISPALSISQGAAHYCNMIMMPTVRGPIVQEKTVHPLGLEIAGRRFLEIVKAGIDIPKEGLVVEAGELLTTNFDNVTSMAIVVYENTIPSTDDKTQYVNQEGMKRLAGTSLRGIPQGPRGQEKVQIIFNVSQENMLKVTAKSTSASGVETELSVDELY
ncbi:Hsp70 family protein [Anaeropeptidivorans aminofermentans]|jgi:molecular chaperone DnaK (HSP70)|uniref:Hsp70 family protein n=1 Tax=Anaeropeptidivorans aminofermentans TaxID=2934315 RepID=UPI002024AA34|nr:Hsp70 family protein [Anaeropeptidivorans aminofermentans]